MSTGRTIRCWNGDTVRRRGYWQNDKGAGATVTGRAQTSGHQVIKISQETTETMRKGCMSMTINISVKEDSAVNSGLAGVTGATSHHAAGCTRASGLTCSTQWVQGHSGVTQTARKWTSGSRRSPESRYSTAIETAQMFCNLWLWCKPRGSAQMSETRVTFQERLFICIYIWCSTTADPFKCVSHVCVCTCVCVFVCVSVCLWNWEPQPSFKTSFLF